jgi:hypothetical protein
MSRVQYSFENAAAIAAKPEGRRPRLSRANLPSRRYLRLALENLGLFAFGFGSSALLIHIAAGFFLASRMSSLLSLVNI